MASRPEKWSCSIVAVDAEGRPIGQAGALRRDAAVHLHQIVVDELHRAREQAAPCPSCSSARRAPTDAPA